MDNAAWAAKQSDRPSRHSRRGRRSHLPAQLVREREITRAYVVVAVLLLVLAGSVALMLKGCSIGARQEASESLGNFGR